MRVLNKSIVDKMKDKYIWGCRIVLDEMNDPYRNMPKGLQGTVIGVDDCGTIHCSWDNGSTLGVAYGEDRCHLVASEDEVKISLNHIGKEKGKKIRCPRCGEYESLNNRLLALSRRANIHICDKCGMKEALEDFNMLEKIPLKEWKIVKEKWIL